MRSYRPEGPLPAFYPSVPAVVGTRLGGRANLCPAVWNTGLSATPPLFGVALSPKRFAHGLLLKARRFSVSFHPHSQAPLAHHLGSVSGRTVDEGEAPRFPGHTGVPIPEEAYAAYELEPLAIHPFGDQDLFVGRVVAVGEEGTLLGEMEKPRPGLSLLYYGRLAEEAFRP